MTDPLADMLARLRNAILVHKPKTEVPYSSLKFEVAKILEQEGYLSGFSKSRLGNNEILELELKYVDGKSVITGIELVSKAGQRIYAKAGTLPEVLGGLGTLIVSTSQGLMTGKEARRKNLGGEVLIKIW